MWEKAEWVEKIRQAAIWGDAEWERQLTLDDGKGELIGIDREGLYEASFAEAFLAHVTPSSVVMDVGASHGFYSVMAAQVCRPENIHCFEPTREARYLLGVNNRTFCQGRLKIIPCLVGAVSQGDQVALSDYCLQQGLQPTLAKLDIEGAEIEAVKGMREICQRHRPVLLIEFHMRRLREQWSVDPHELLKDLRSLGYRLRFNGHHGCLTANGRERDPAWHDTLPNERLPAVLAEPAE